MWRRVVKCPTHFLLMTTAILLLNLTIIGYFYNRLISARTCTTTIDIEISTTRDTRYVLYGKGLADEQTTKRLRSYIRSITSIQAPGGVRLSSKPERQHFSQIGESEFVDKLLKGRRQGVFIECGAAEGEELSNSLFFELHRNWTGILIEGNPHFHPALLSKNRNAYVVRSCLSTTTQPQTVEFKLAEFGSGISNKMHKSVIREFHLESKPSVDVQCFPLNSITAALGIQHVDYLSLDVEGPELDILSIVDWTQLSIDVMTVEYGKKTDKLKQLRALLTSNGTFTEVALLPVGSSDTTGQDVVFMRTAL